MRHFRANWAIGKEPCSLQHTNELDSDIEDENILIHSDIEDQSDEENSALDDDGVDSGVDGDEQIMEHDYDNADVRITSNYCDYHVFHDVPVSILINISCIKIKF